jgi:hypothetical protein
MSHSYVSVKAMCEVCKDPHTVSKCSTFKQLPIKFPSDVVVADKNFNKPAPIDILLGAEIFFE